MTRGIFVVGAFYRGLPFSLAYLGAVAGILGVAQAGQITYDFVDPATGANGYNVVGSITVNSAGISAAPVSLTPSMVQSWHVSVFDSANIVQFSLDSTSDSLILTSDSLGSLAPVVTLTSVYIPIVPAPPIFGLINTNDSFFQVEASVPPNGSFVRWMAEDAFGTYLRSGTSQFYPSGTTLFDTFDVTRSILTVAAVAEPVSVVPEPSSLGIAATLFGTFGLARLWRRSSGRQPVIERG